MLAPRAARWVEEWAGSGENAFTESAALSFDPAPSSTLTSLRQRARSGLLRVVFDNFVSPC